MLLACPLQGYSKIKYYGVTSAGTDTPKSTRYPYIPASPPPCARVYSAAMNSSCTCLRTHLQPFAARMHDKVALGDKNFPTEAHWQQVRQAHAMRQPRARRGQASAGQPAKVLPHGSMIARWQGCRNANAAVQQQGADD